MKTFKFIAAALAMASLLAFSANAQENGNRDENGKIVRGAYETNSACSNWFIGAGAGVNSLYNGASDFGLNGVAIDAFVGKWFTPSIGARVGYRGLQNSLNLKKGYSSSNLTDDNFSQHFYHADFLWNFSNAVSGYKETRFWDFIPYVQTGVYDLHQDGKQKNYELGLGAGLLNDLRLGGRVDLYLDLSAVMVADQMFSVKGDGKYAVLPSLTAGLIVNLGKKTNFDRHSSVAPVVAPLPFTLDQYNALKDRVAALEKENASLNDEIERLKNRAPETIYVQNDAVESSSYSFFDLGSATLSDREKMHLDFYANAVAENLGDQTLVVTGSADKATGSEVTNQKLAQKRADAVKDYLVKKGVPASKIETVALGGISGSKDARRVIVEVK